MTMTAPQTMTKAKSVPMLVISARMLSGMKPAIEATKMPVRMVDFHGVRNVGWMSPKKPRGTRPSRAIASMTRGWLSIITRSTEVMPVIAPAATRYCIQCMPARLKASTTGALMSMSLVGTIAVNTAATAM